VQFRKLLTCLAVPCVIAADGAAAVPTDPVQPIPIVLLRRSDKKAPKGSGVDVLVPAKAGDDVARRASALLRAADGFGQHALRLDRFVKTYLLRDSGTSSSRRDALEQPAFLFLSDRQGGFPAESFWLEQPDGRLREMRDVGYVDMIVGARDLEPGRIDGLQEIFAHELGHLMMAALAGPAPKRASTAMHFVTTRTDAWYAFTEGFGEHFQPAGVDWQHDAATRSARRQEVPEVERTWYGRFEREETAGCVVCPANLRFLRWQPAREQRLRDGALRANVFAYRPSMPGSLVNGSRPSFESRLYRDLAVPGPGATLKNGVQMMESEGVIATLFYRLVNDPRLRAHYREPSFYEPFLDDAQAASLRASGPAAVVTPAENVYLKLFDVMHRSFEWGDWPAVALIQGYARRFPDEAAPICDVFLEVTRGVTVEREAALRHREPGYLAALRDRVLAGRVALDGNLGRAIWMSAPTMTFGLGVYRYFIVPTSFTFDLNAADVPDLLSVPGVSPQMAEAIVGAREARGHFAEVNDLAIVPGVTPPLLESFRSMAETMRERLARPEPRTNESGWFKDVLVPLLLASYYVAAAWQFGAALVLGGLAFLAARGAARRALRVVPEVASRPRPRWWRRLVRGVGRGCAGAALPCLASVGIYAVGVLPTAANMAAVGAALGSAAAVVLVFAGRTRGRVGAALSFALGTLAASVTIGWMY
jgi:hypothetical protein